MSLCTMKYTSGNSVLKNQKRTYLILKITVMGFLEISVCVFYCLNIDFNYSMFAMRLKYLNNFLVKNSSC